MNDNSPKQDSLTRQSTYLAIGKGLEFVIHMVHPIILVRLFAQTEYGIYRQLMLIFSTLLPIGQMGITQALYYFIPRETHKKDIIIFQTIIFALVGASLIFGSLALFREAVAGLFHNEEMIQYIPCIGAYCFFMIASAPFEPSLIAESRTQAASFVFVATQAVQTLLIIATAFCIPKIMALLYALVIFSAIRFSIQTGYFIRQYKLSFRAFSWPEFKRQIGYSIPIGLGNISWFLQTRMSSFFISYYFDATSFAIFSIGSYKLPLVTTITNSVANVMIPELSRFQKENRHDAILRIWHNATRKMNLILFPMIVFFIVFAKEFIITLFTEQYAESALLFQISLLSFSVAGINIGALLSSYAETTYLMNIGFLRLPVTIIVLYVFTTRWGMIGAMSSNVLVMIVFRLIGINKTARLMKIPLHRIIQWTVHLKILGAAFLAVLPLMIVRNFLSLPPIIVLITAAPTFLLGYIFLSIWLETILPKEIDALCRFIGTRLKIFNSVLNRGQPRT